ncbi:hypothetical protein GO495_11605 [Chitinophaga oryziterrae]|uniref:Uncharacterized protein n=1 Tax=Chitinophaga oryziterrae TaxID=1031224 RepID=A0A6N8J7P0_9BACT|nr:type IV toxin-antitoxin system AbiEi family antitoxin [Chitinophaga oryziterrae]MVT41230.1 hypothetical protein [Chitinophaga oryziterrae]
MNKGEIIQIALNQLKEKAGIHGTYDPHNNEGTDGQLVIHLKNQDLHLNILIKSELRPYNLPEQLGNKLIDLLVVDKLYPVIKNELRNKHIGYLDTVGNLYIENGDTVIWLEGNKPAIEHKKSANRAFTKTGLKAVFYFLWKKEAINYPYRKIAADTKISLGNIPQIIEGLKEGGYILEIDEKRLYIKNQRALLDRWIEGYREVLKPTLHIGDYRIKNDDLNMLEATLFPYKETMVIGGEAAAEHLTKYLQAEIVTLYTTMPKMELMYTLRLIPEKEGRLQIFEKFWHDDTNIDDLFAPTLLVYADLVITDEPRCLETAAIIYDKYLKNEFGEY